MTGAEADVATGVGVGVGVETADELGAAAGSPDEQAPASVITTTPTAIFAVRIMALRVWLEEFIERQFSAHTKHA